MCEYPSTDADCCRNRLSKCYNNGMVTRRFWRASAAICLERTGGKLRYCELHSVKVFAEFQRCVNLDFKITRSKASFREILDFTMSVPSAFLSAFAIF